MVLQQKETGTTVDFSKAKEIKDFKKICYRNDRVGILTYQTIPVTINASVRDALLNGNIADIAGNTDAQGMQTNYAVISWNETAQNGGYYITDLRIGVVFVVTRDWNTGPSYCLTSLEAIPWLSPVLTIMGMTNYGYWKAWELTNMSRAEPTYLHMVEELVSENKWVGYPIGNQPPPLPDAATIKSTIETQGDVQGALGKFITGLSDKGVATTILGNGYGIDVALYQSPTGMPVPGNPYARSYYYQVHVRFWWECTTNPDIDIQASNVARQGILIAIGVILALAIAVGVMIAIPIMAYNLTHQESSYTKKTTLPDGTVIEESGSSSGPPDFWGWVLPVVALVGAVTVAGFLWNLRPQRRRSEED